MVYFTTPQSKLAVEILSDFSLTAICFRKCQSFATNTPPGCWLHASAPDKGSQDLPPSDEGGGETVGFDGGREVFEEHFFIC